MAEVMKYNDFKEEGSESAAKVCVYIEPNYGALLNFCQYQHWLTEKHPWIQLKMCPLSQAAGKYRQQGRNYVVEDGDIIFFKFNTPNAPKKKPWETTRSAAGELRIRFSWAPKCNTVCWFSYFSFELTGSVHGLVGLRYSLNRPHRSIEMMQE